jgi:hypothetical protein
MNNLKLITQYSPWFLLLCILAGVAYAWLLYSGKHVWGKKINLLLSALRFLLVSLLAFLLLGPLIKHYKNNLEFPSVVIALDNSQSVGYTTKTEELSYIKGQITALSRTLGADNVKVEIRLLDRTISPEELQKIPFNLTSTNLSKLLSEIQSDYTNRNLAGILLLTDGIHNQGVAPNYERYHFPVHTVGLGDTVPKKDISIKTLLYNKISYTGNSFPVMAEIHNTGFKNRQVTVLLKQNGNILQKKTVLLKNEKEIAEAEFQVSAEKNGLQHYIVETVPLEEEFSKNNNLRHAYVEVIEGKEKILLVATAPHPDIKAIRSAVEKKQNYEMQVYIPGIDEFKNDKFDLVIFHQIPDNYHTAEALKDKFLKEQVPVLFIVGSQTNLGLFNSSTHLINISGRTNQTDEVIPFFNEAFGKFRFEPEDKKVLNAYPPITVPFGNYGLSNEAEVILYQKIGLVPTKKPILAVSSGQPKIGVFVGDGLWEWQLHEFNETNDTKTFDKLITNLIQFLSSREDKRKFRVYPVSNEFLLSEPLLFETEIYNDIYEKVYGHKVDLKIKDEKGGVISYSFENGETSPRFQVKGLPQGIYKYEATATVNNKTEKSSGEFSVKDLNLEAFNTTADHEILKLLASQSGGRFFLPSALPEVAAFLKQQHLKNIIHTQEEYEDLVSTPWILCLLLLFVFTEWFVRKYKGTY